MLELWFGTFIAEGIILTVRPLWRFRRFLSSFLIVYIIISSAWLCLNVGVIGTIPIVILAIFRIGNLLRIIKNRMHTAYLKRVTSRTALALFVLHPLMIGGLFLPLVLSPNNAINALIKIQFIVASGILLITVRNIRKLSFKMPDTHMSDKELPTVTVAIPARNESNDLRECLNSIIANDYPKLEIIVLDDCSQARTADVIKGFAQDGVRFIPGNPPAERWLAKNQAYQTLYEHASGGLVLFCGVDVRLGSQAIRSMVNLLNSRNKSMLSVLPIRIDSSPSHAFIQPMRYWWELALPRRLFNRPPVLSTCWMISRAKLRELGGFSAVSHAILPEGFFARELVKTDRYSFVRASNELEVKTVKKVLEQYATAIRQRYPQIRKRPEWALILTFANILLLLMPFGLLVASIWVGGYSFWLVLGTCLMLVCSHVLIVNITDPANSLFSAVTFPLAVFSELIIGYNSMLKYEFFTINWKDRNICIPVMHVIPRLPNIK